MKTTGDLKWLLEHTENMENNKNKNSDLKTFNT